MLLLLLLWCIGRVVAAVIALAHLLHFLTFLLLDLFICISFSSIGASSSTLPLTTIRLVVFS